MLLLWWTYRSFLIICMSCPIVSGDKENDDSKPLAAPPADDRGKGKAPAAEAPDSDEEEGGEQEEGEPGVEG